MLTVDFRKIDGFPPDRSADRPTRVLDIGCGGGRHVCKAAEYPGVFVVGADRDPAEVKAAQGQWADHRNLIARGGDAGMAAADIRALPFRDNAFDLTICSEVLEHIPDHEAAAAELARVTRRSRPLVVSVPRYLPERICWALSNDYHANPGGHIRIYTRKRLGRLLETAGLVPWSRHWAHALHSPYWWLICLVGKDGKGWGKRAIDLYHRFLVWDLMTRPRLVRRLEWLLNPLLGKSLVVYCRKAQRPGGTRRRTASFLPGGFV